MFEKPYIMELRLQVANGYTGDQCCSDTHTCGCCLTSAHHDLGRSASPAVGALQALCPLPCRRHRLYADKE